MDVLCHDDELALLAAPLKGTVCVYVCVCVRAKQRQEAGKIKKGIHLCVYCINECLDMCASIHVCSLGANQSHLNQRQLSSTMFSSI